MKTSSIQKRSRSFLAVLLSLCILMGIIPAIPLAQAAQTEGEWPIIEDGWTIYDDDCTDFITYSSDWTEGATGNYGPDIRWTETGWAEFTFTGIQFKIEAKRNNNQGVMQVEIDGEPAIEIDTYSSASQLETVYTSPYLENKEHTVVIRAAGKNNGQALGNYIVLDAVSLVETTEDQPIPLREIAMDGEPLQLALTQQEHSVTMPFDYDGSKIPQISAVPEEGWSVEITQASSVPGTATITCSKEGEEPIVYTLHFTIKYANRVIPIPSQVEGVETVSSTLNSDDGIEWKFCMEPQGEFWKPENVLEQTWEDIQVPSEIMMQGYNIEFDKEYAYTTQIDIPQDFEGKRVVLKFDGVQYHARVWVNGQYIRDHDGGFTTWDCDITDAVIPGEKATLVVGVTGRNEQVTKADLYAHHNIAGILRDVTLLAAPFDTVTRFQYETDLDEAYQDADLNITTEVNFEESEEVELTYLLKDMEGNLISTVAETLSAEEEQKTTSIHVENPNKWTAEEPYLYTLVCEVRRNGEIEQTLEQMVGFREIEIKGVEMYINGEKVKLVGVARHDVSPTQGRSTTQELDEEDIKLYKEANVNYIRTSHYPPSPALLAAADKYGMYIEEETAAFQSNPSEGNEAYFMNQFSEMIERDKSHPCVIMWSLGNELSYGHSVQMEMAFVRANDPTRPALVSGDMAAGTAGNQASDIVGNHYRYGDALKQVSEYNKPVLLDEVAHVESYNNAQQQKRDLATRNYWGRALKDGFDYIYENDGLLGGAIWCAIDDVFELPAASEIGEVENLWGDTHSSGNSVGFGQWGIIDIWRRPKPEYWAVKNTFAPVQIENEPLIEPEKGISVENRYNHTNLKELTMEWEVIPADGSEGESGTIAGPDIAPLSSGTLFIPYSKEWKLGDKLHLTFTQKHLTMGDLQCAEYELAVGEKKVTFPTQTQGALEIRENDEQVEVAGSDFSVTFSKQTGLISSGVINGKEVIKSGPYLNLDSIASYVSTPFTKEDWVKDSFTFEKSADGNEVVVTTSGGYASAAGVTYTIKVDSAGQIEVSYTLDQLACSPKYEAGIGFELNPEVDELSWECDGVWSMYDETDDHIGRSQGTAQKIYEDALQYEYRSGKPSWPWSHDIKDFFLYTEEDTGEGRWSRDFSSGKENIYYASAILDETARVRVESDARQAVRMGKDGDSMMMLVNDQWYYEDPWSCSYTDAHHTIAPVKVSNGEKCTVTLRLTENDEDVQTIYEEVRGSIDGVSLTGEIKNGADLTLVPEITGTLEDLVYTWYQKDNYFASPEVIENETKDSITITDSLLGKYVYGEVSLADGSQKQVSETVGIGISYIDDADPQTIYNPPASHVSASGEGLFKDGLTWQNNGSVTVTFEGTGIRWGARPDPNMGTAIQVYIDDELVDTVNINGEKHSAIAFEAYDLSDGEHTIRLETGEGAWLAHDMFEIISPLAQYEEEQGTLDGVSLTGEIKNGATLTLVPEITGTLEDLAYTWYQKDNYFASPEVIENETKDSITITDSLLGKYVYGEVSLADGSQKQVSETVGIGISCVDDADPQTIYNPPASHVPSSGEGLFEDGLTWQNSGSVTLTFEGTGIRWGARPDPNMGTAIQVYIDDELVDTVNISGEKRSVIAFEAYDLSDGEHTIRLETGEGAWLAHDMFEIISPLEDAEISGADKTELSAFVIACASYQEEKYTAGSWATFQTAMDNAKAVLDNADATQTEVDEAAAALQSAVDGLVNISTLEYVLNIANGHVEAGDVDKLVPSAQEVFNKVLASAQAIYDNPDATQEQVDTAWKTLMYAIQAMGFVPGDKTELIDLVAEAKALDLNAYEDGAEKDAFTAALKAAEDLIADPDAMELDIDAAYQALSDAMQNLIPKPTAGDKTELKKVIDEADGKNSELDRYVDDAEAKQKFADALAAAKEVYEKDGATQDEIDQARNDLIDAMTGLRLRADKDNLNKWLEDLKSIDLSQYTEESAAVVRAVIAKAEALAAQDLDENDQDLINAMVAEMAIAKAQLVPAPADPEDPENPNPGNGSGEGSNPENSKPKDDASSQSEANSEGKEATDEVPTTGDATPIAGLSLLAVAAAGTMLLMKKRKN